MQRPFGPSPDDAPKVSAGHDQCGGIERSGASREGGDGLVSADGVAPGPDGEQGAIDVVQVDASAFDVVAASNQLVVLDELTHVGLVGARRERDVVLRPGFGEPEHRFGSRFEHGAEEVQPGSRGAHAVQGEGRTHHGGRGASKERCGDGGVEPSRIGEPGKRSGLCEVDGAGQVHEGSEAVGFERGGDDREGTSE